MLHFVKERNDTLENEKLDRFINAVNSVTDKQVKEILDEANAEKEAILNAAAEKAEKARQRNLSDNLKMTENKYVRMISRTELELKKEVLLCREELTRGLFEKVIERLREFTSTAEYGTLILERLGQEDSLSGAKICLAPSDMHLADSIKKVYAEAEVVPDDSIKYGGFFILRPDKGTVIDRTFDCLLDEQQSLFASRNILSAREGQK